MVTCERVKYPRRCGRCGRVLELGAPVLVFTIGKIEKVRGECCEGAAPPDLPELVPLAPVPLTPFMSIRTIGNDVLPLDWRRRQAGDE